jgi:hypothetical protein
MPACLALLAVDAAVPHAVAMARDVAIQPWDEFRKSGTRFGARCMLAGRLGPADQVIGRGGRNSLPETAESNGRRENRVTV